MRDAFFNDYYVAVAADCVAEASEERHTYALKKMAQAFGVVRTGAEIAAVWDRSRTNTASWSPDRKLAASLRSLTEKVAPAHTALILVDFQNDFCHPDGAMGRRGEDLAMVAECIPAAGRLLASARAAGTKVIHVQATYGATDASEARLAAERQSGSVECCRPGSWGARTVDQLTPHPGESIVTKHRFSAFLDTGLEKLLRSSGIRTAIVAGVATQCCVESTVRDAALRDYYVVVPRDAVSARGRMRHLHEASLETMGLYFADVATVDEISAGWDRRPLRMSA